MRGPAKYDIVTWTGTDFSESYEAQNDDLTAFDLTGSELVFRALDASGTELFRFSSEDATELEITDASAGEYTFSLTGAQTRLVPLGRVAKYEIERRVGTSQESFMAGFLIGEGGANDD